jgi:glycosyltransferase involved in cell wall biosynthesis
MRHEPEQESHGPQPREEVTDLLQISLGTTRGLRLADASFAELARRAGASVETVAVRIGAGAPLRRAYPVNDVVEALAARRAAASALRRLRPRAVVFSSTTAALLAPDPGVPYAIRLDSPARLNRPGLQNLPVHVLERRRLAGASLVLPWSRAAAGALPDGAPPAVVVPPPLSVGEAPPEPRAERERVAVAYTPDPKAKGLDLLCRAWALAGLADARLEVFGIEPSFARQWLRRKRVAEPAGLVWRGWVAPEEFHAALRRSWALVASARWEDFGIAQLEALALGALLVCTATEGPFEARAIARELVPELVADDQSPEALAACLTAAFALSDGAAVAYRREAKDRLEPYRPGTIGQTIAERVLPALLAG